MEARLALTLRAVVGMSTPQIARAFLVPEATMAQRLVRAKRKITQAGIPFTIPGCDELAPRLDDVLTVVYLSYNAGYLDPSAGRARAERRRGLAGRAGGPGAAGPGRGLGTAGPAHLPFRAYAGAVR